MYFCKPEIRSKLAWIQQQERDLETNLANRNLSEFEKSKQSKTSRKVITVSSKIKRTTGSQSELLFNVNQLSRFFTYFHFQNPKVGALRVDTTLSTVFSADVGVVRSCVMSVNNEKRLRYF